MREVVVVVVEEEDVRAWAWQGRQKTACGRMEGEREQRAEGRAAARDWAVVQRYNELR